MSDEDDIEIRLTPKGWKVLADTLQNPPAPSKKLLDAWQKYREAIASGRLTVSEDVVMTPADLDRQLAEAHRRGAIEALGAAEKEISSIGQGVHDGTIDVILHTSLMWLVLNRVSALRALYEKQEGGE